MKRFLRYSLEKGKKIRAMLMLDGQMVQRTMLVLEETDDGITALIGTGKKPKQLAYEDILSCDYARGDHGEE
ncbi:MAG: hypothetical protein J6K73_11040 [Clostridia bacterium]|nr:hypothetical protein [Clostridia bacterium]MBP3650303.1 hypothetical protein [Clostridia bacterium]